MQLVNKVGVHPRIFGDAIDIHLLFKDGTFRQFGELVMKPAEDGIQVPPAFSLEIKEAQELMDKLWQCGLRPTEGTGSAGSLAATQRHLEDMRTLVFKKEGA